MKLRVGTVHLAVPTAPLQCFSACTTIHYQIEKLTLRREIIHATRNLMRLTT